MKVLVTGAAGFIGSALTLGLLKRGDVVVGIDNHNDYYDAGLKDKRIERHTSNMNYTHLRIDIANNQAIKAAFLKHKPDRVVNLAAQAGVRYSVENPYAYINSNISGFLNILEACRNSEVEHLIYASSSSVYGGCENLPFSIHQNVDHPLSIYAASKKSNELMAHSYSHQYKLPTTGLRFFTVYGPWGRPDMALFKFTKSIILGEKIKVFNFGKHRRDFTYIEDIVNGLIRVIDQPALPNEKWDPRKPEPGTSNAPWRIYNIGNNNPVELMDFISILESSIGKRALLDMLPLQRGDVLDTHADVDELIQDFGYKPTVMIEEGIQNFVAWYRKFYSV